MNFLLAVVLVPLYFFLPGYLFSRLLIRNPGAFSPGERIFIPIAASVCATAWIALTLAEVGFFSLLNLALAVLVLCAVLWLAARGRAAAWILRDLRPDWIFLALLGLAILLFAHPAEYVLGNSDAGVYINTGANIARTGSLAIHDAEVALIPPDPAKTYYWQLINPYMLYKQVRLPGFFIADQASGLVLPQFLHLYPAWLAIWDAMLGVQLGLYATPIIALLGAVAFYFVTRELFGIHIARLAFLLFVLTVPVFWFARYPVAEAMTQFLALTAMFALLKMSRFASKAATKNTTEKEIGASSTVTVIGLAILGGVAFGQLFLVRSDSILFLVPLVLYALVLIFFRRWRREHWAFFGAFGVIFVQAVAHMLVFSPNYLYYQYSHAMRMQNIDKLLRIDLPHAEDLFTRIEYALLLVGLAAVGVVAVFLFDRLFQIARARWGTAVGAFFTSRERIIRILGTAVVVLCVAALYFVLGRPETLYGYIGGLTPSRGEANLVKLGWYLSPIGVGLAVLGAAVILLRDLNSRNLFFFGTSALFSAFYLEELYSNPHYIYTVRHYIPLVIPLFILCAARGLGWLWSDLFADKPTFQRLARVGAVALFAGWMLYNVYAMGIVDGSRAQGLAIRLPFLSQTTFGGGVRFEPISRAIVGFDELGGAYAQMEQNAEQIPPNAVVLFSAGRDEPAALATPLKYIFDRDAFVTVFNNPPGPKVAANIDEWHARGRDVLLAFGTNGGKLQIPNYELEPVGALSLDVPQWAFAYDFMPRSSWRVHLDYALYRAVPRDAPDAYPFVLDFGGNDYPYLVRGFMERTPEANSRWTGAILAENRDLQDAESFSGTVRVPVAATTADKLALTIRARAPRSGAQLRIRHGNRPLGEFTLTNAFEDYTFNLDPSLLQTTADGYLLELNADSTLDGEGRILGAEFESLEISELP